MASSQDNTRKVLIALRRAIDEAVATAAQYGVGQVKDQFKQILTVAGPPTRDGSIPELLGVRVKDQPPSPPGTAPNSKSQRLRGSILAARIRPGQWVVGTNVQYARVHELGGTIKTGRRPYIVIDGKAVFISKATERKRKAKKQYVKYTKGTATYPKRPYMLPAFNKNRDKFALIVQRKAALEFRRNMGGIS